MRRILFSVSGHGLGHLNQAAALMQAVHARHPDIAITVRSSLDRARIEQRLGFPVAYLDAQDDFGVRIRNGFDVDLPETGRAYDRMAARWPEVLGRAKADIAAVRPDLIVANVGFVPLAAGAELGIPSLGLASLDWHTVLAGYWAGERAQVLDLMDAAYASAEALLAFAPTTAEAAWRRRISLGPAAEAGRPRGDALRARLGLPRGQRLVLCAFGNSAPPPPRTDLLACAGTTFLVPARWSAAKSTVAVDGLDWPFIDLLASCDACLAKLGYGIAAEAVRNAVPLLYHRRPGWREDDALAGWTEAHGRARQIDLAALDADGLRHALDRFAAEPAPAAPAFMDPDAAVSTLLSAAL
ncbi:hypothetical protein Q8W71_22955 [Methylobacterium sp. NEAU 140]|uniref:hypothetical protein n=1 Tax=Methylobacterium sp. NEAU 140 TaxID=3064945 RepID=UPI002734BEA8|nr:hypothetical protein [Methylobacterium sp. NEAU 140]MDP4025497.1 hypothetical protein [Methylobacterium sp. NEAU 140]